MIKNIIVFALILLATDRLQAQSFEIGVEAGGSASMGKFGILGINSPDVFSSYASSIRLGARIGLPTQYYLTDKMALHSGLFMAMKGNVVTEKNKSSAFGLLYNVIELPIALVYVANKEAANHFFVGGGPYIGYVSNGTLKAPGANGQEISRKIQLGNNNTQHDMKPLECGLHVQTGFRFHNGILLRFVAQRQLNNLGFGTNRYGFNSIQNKAFAALTVAYLFKFK